MYGSGPPGRARRRGLRRVAQVDREKLEPLKEPPLDGSEAAYSPRTTGATSDAHLLLGGPGAPVNPRKRRDSVTRTRLFVAVPLLLACSVGYVRVLVRDVDDGLEFR